MSPSPDQQNEPKAPDKSGNKLSDLQTGKVATGGSETQVRFIFFRCYNQS